MSWLVLRLNCIDRTATLLPPPPHRSHFRICSQDETTGEVSQEHMKDVTAVVLYKQMKATLVYLTHLDPQHTQQIMLEQMKHQVRCAGRGSSDEKLQLMRSVCATSGQVNMRDPSKGWAALNTLCWAIGAITGSFTEEDEKKFLVTIIKDLLALCEMTRGKGVCR